VIVHNLRSTSVKAEFTRVDKESKKENVIKIESIPYDIDAVQEESIKIYHLIQNQYDREQFNMRALKQI